MQLEEEFSPLGAAPNDYVFWNNRSQRGLPLQFGARR
jgi:hypothetical protein